MHKGQRDQWTQKLILSSRVAKRGVSGTKRRYPLQSVFKAKWRRLLATMGHLSLLVVVGRARRFRFSSDPQPTLQRKDNYERKTCLEKEKLTLWRPPLAALSFRVWRCALAQWKGGAAAEPSGQGRRPERSQACVGTVGGWGGRGLTAEGGCSQEMKRRPAPWEERYHKSRQCILKQRHHFANEGP